MNETYKCASTLDVRRRNAAGHTDIMPTLKIIHRRQALQLHYWIRIKEGGIFFCGRWHNKMTTNCTVLFSSVFALWSKLQTVIFLKSCWHSFVSGSCQKQRRPGLVLASDQKRRTQFQSHSDWKHLHSWDPRTLRPPCPTARTCTGAL